MSELSSDKTALALARAEKFAKTLQAKFTAAESFLDSLSSPRSKVSTPRQKKTLQISVHSKSDINIDVAGAGPAQDVSRRSENYPSTSPSGVNNSNQGKKKVSVEDFESLAIIGRGAFGEVRLVRKKGDPSSREVYGAFATFLVRFETKFYFHSNEVDA